jgi:hypothetical protein
VIETTNLNLRTIDSAVNMTIVERLAVDGDVLRYEAIIDGRPPGAASYVRGGRFKAG